MHSTSAASIFRQPKSVWAVAFGCVIAFMGIGLVDPILPAISAQLGASPTEAMLLFTSYLLITGLAMFITSFVSSRLGARRTLLAGLLLIVVFAALAGASDTVNQIIGFRGGWGLGNALFISTALSAIVGAARGGVDSAIILYEAALGLGIAAGPLLGGALGAVSWRGPFFGTAVLMGIGFLAILVLLDRSGASAVAPLPITAPFHALRHAALRTLALAALCYNFGFFTLLAYSPFPLTEAAARRGLVSFGAEGLGLIFCGWGIGLAITSVLAAPRLAARYGRLRILVAMLLLLTVDLLVLAALPRSFPVLVAGVVVGGLFLGVLNTVLTQSVMEATDLPRNVASSTYSGVRFLGGAVAPAVAGSIAAHIGTGAPYLIGAGAIVVSAAILILGRQGLAVIETGIEEDALDEAEILTAADA